MSELVGGRNTGGIIIKVAVIMSMESKRISGDVANSSWKRRKQPRQATGASWEGGGGREDSGGGFLCKRKKKNPDNTAQFTSSRCLGPSRVGVPSIHLSASDSRGHRNGSLLLFFFHFLPFFQLQLQDVFFFAHLTCRGLQQL